MTKRPVMLISEHLAVRGYHGGCTHLAAFAEALKQRGHSLVHVWLGGRGRKRPFRNPFRLAGGGVLEVPGALCLGRWVVPGLGRRPDTGAWIQKCTLRHNPALVLLDHAIVAQFWIKTPAFPAWIITHDVLTRRDEILKAGALWDANAPISPPTGKEAELLRRADGLIAIQDCEAAFFRTMVPGMPVVTVPHPVSPDLLPLVAGIHHTLLFVGGSSLPNVDGLKWFLSEVFPLVLKGCPDVVLEVAGAVAGSIPDHDAVRKLGHVDDLRSVYARAQICVAPLRFGTGLKIKVVEAMGYGRPVIGTATAAEGFADLPAALGWVSDDAEDFAEAVLAFLQDEYLREKAASRQLAWVVKHLSPEAALKPLSDMLAMTGGSRG